MHATVYDMEISEDRPAALAAAARSSRSSCRALRWERANAIDSDGYVVSSIVAPALAGTERQDRGDAVVGAGDAAEDLTGVSGR